MQHADTATSGATHPFDAPDTEVQVPTSTNQIPIAFTGSGSEYFRIWIVNLLLMLVTLGLYFPWAKARRLRYFMGNTLVGGQPLGFHGDPKKMFKGYALVGILFILYSIAGEFSSMAGLVALVLVAGLWPALFKSSMQFRLANTSWRGLRFRFTGDLPSAYRAVLPLFLPGLVLVGGLAFVNDESAPPAWFGFLALGVMLTTLAITPWLMWNLKQYQHNHYSLGHLQTSFRASVGSFYKLSLKIVGFGLLATLLPVAVTMGTLFGLDAVDKLREGKGIWMVMVTMLPTLLGFIVAMIAIKPYAVARLQNLVWTKTGNTELRFVSTLRVRSLLWVTLKNWLLIVITLGLYWPFAAVALARVRLEAVSVKSRANPDLLVSQVHPREGDAAGDAAGDFFGLDVGL
ncbi:MAG: hypothetical protein A3E00_08035 [Curvibacter sp. RIFCSPHIGHO2_12_FULL_63_18]|uniref:YjgN family protein n=1 Tax=Rhodoferax sp. TaxID=50421 RepID=UPI0008BCB02E|nr:YjgN family protein [Rhodoferax sp.]OGP01593.1 MAG: hypothetical protein A2037_17330 [Curvibacter sp. GWA2_63_95]OGP02959.1 MAG: hypothetical protein A3E00_08035 [Curvibacter sp. RIFCSPHIGHO2_12_FULL_63_18]HCX83262.1 DUF898 domain-containing protein [Rhodoferax sp.]